MDTGLVYEIQSGRAIEVKVRATAVNRAYQRLRQARRLKSKKQTHLLGRPRGLYHRPFVASCLLQDEKDRVKSSRLCPRVKVATRSVAGRYRSPTKKQPEVAKPERGWLRGSEVKAVIRAPRCSLEISQAVSEQARHHQANQPSFLLLHVCASRER